MSGVTKAPPTVVLLHGLSLGSWAMKRVEWSLARAGYRVVNLSYPSLSVPVDQLATCWLPEQLARRGLPDGRELGFVTHSMGGILLRAWLRQTGVPPGLRRAVMLVPPNQGTELVDRITTWRTFRWITGLNGCRLGTGPDSFPRQLGPWPEQVELGVIAADRPILPTVVRWTEDAHDGKVPVSSTRLPGMKAHLVLHHSHTWIQYRRPAIRQVLHFLREGCFAGGE